MKDGWGGAKYPGNSTERMLNNLRTIKTDLRKISCFDSDAQAIDKNAIIPKPDICFIDGEHTNKQVISDFKFCRSVLNENGVIIFHDAGVVAEGIDFIIKRLRQDKVKFKGFCLPDFVFVLDFTRGKIIYKRIMLENFIKILRGIYSKFPQPIKNIIRPLLKSFRLKQADKMM